MISKLFFDHFLWTWISLCIFWDIESNDIKKIRTFKSYSNWMTTYFCKMPILPYNLKKYVLFQLLILSSNILNTVIICANNWLYRENLKKKIFFYVVLNYHLFDVLIKNFFFIFSYFEAYSTNICYLIIYICI